MALSCIFKHIPIISGATHHDTHFVNKGLLFRRSVILTALSAIGSYALSVCKKIDIKIIAKYVAPAIAAAVLLDCIISKIASRNRLKEAAARASQATPPPPTTPELELPPEPSSTHASDSEGEIQPGLSPDADPEPAAVPCSSADIPEPSSSKIYDLLFDSPKKRKPWINEIRNLTPEEFKGYVANKHGSWFGIRETLRMFLIWTEASIPLIREFLDYLKGDDKQILSLYFDMLRLGGPQLFQIISALEQTHPLNAGQINGLIASVLLSGDIAACTMLFTLRDSEGKLPFNNHNNTLNETTIAAYKVKMTEEWYSNCLKLAKKSPEELYEDSPQKPKLHPLYKSISESSVVSRRLDFGDAASPEGSSLE